MISYMNIMWFDQFYPSFSLLIVFYFPSQLHVLWKKNLSLWFHLVPSVFTPRSDLLLEHGYTLGKCIPEENWLPCPSNHSLLSVPQITLGLHKSYPYESFLGFWMVWSCESIGSVMIAIGNSCTGLAIFDECSFSAGIHCLWLLWSSQSLLHDDPWDLGERKYNIDVPISDENPILSDSLHTGQLELSVWITIYYKNVLTSVEGYTNTCA